MLHTLAVRSLAELLVSRIRSNVCTQYRRKVIFRLEKQALWNSLYQNREFQQCTNRAEFITLIYKFRSTLFEAEKSSMLLLMYYCW